MGGKTSKSTQQISIPPEVLARYNAINARADTVTNKPYQYYTGQFVAPLTATQQSGIANTNAAAGMAQPYFGAATGQLMGAQQAATPYYQGATNQLNQGINTGNALAGQSYNTLNNAQGVGNELAAQSYGNLNNAQNVGNQYAAQSSGTLSDAQNVGNQYAGQSSNTINAAQSEGAGIQQGALGNLGAAYASAQPYNEAAGGLYQQGLGQGSNITGQALSGTQQALAGAQPYQGAATQYMQSGAQAVNPYDLGADQINKYMSPYLNTVLQGTAGLLNQQNQQQQAGQMGNAIRSGAFGGDRGGIAAANLNQQQNLANSKIYSDILNQGFGQALGTAQQQQQLGLGAQQANRAAQQQASQQALAIGQQGFGQGLSAAQQQGALGQQLFNMNSTTGQNAAALGQQVYGQGTNTAQQQSNVGNTLFNQGATTAAQQAALGQQQFAQGATAAQQQAALGQQQFGQGATVAQQQAALGQQQFGQGATTAAQQAALGQQQFAQGNTAAGTSAALGQGIYGMGANTSAQLANLGVGAQDAALSGAGAQLAAGQVDQATQQAENTAKYNEFLQAQSLPYQQLKLAGDIALGTGTASGSTTTTAQPGGFFSDERLKENIKAVGKTFDGQTIHSFNYKGDPRTQIGLIAQEVQKHHPDAVGLAGGYKTVNYDKATEDAADRGHMASGGLASAGGSVMPYNAGQGFANGGGAGFDPAMMQQILAAQQAMYAPLSSNNMYAGGPNAGGGLVPQSTFTQNQLMVPAELARQATGAEQANSIANLGKTVGELGGEVGAWDWGGEEAKKKDKTPVPTTAAASAPAATGVALPEPVDTTAPDPEEFSQKKMAPYALGGGIPYSGQGLDIPDSGLAAGSSSPMTASALQARQSGLDKLNKVANVADAGMKLGKFGKKIGLFADGGGIPYAGQGLDIPDEDDSSKTYQLPTAGDMPDKPKSGFSKAVKVAGTVAKIASMFSDKRMKENIKPIGKMFDGQIVHSFNYKGDPRTQIGLIAQEVEDHKPHAVGLAGKYKTVDYDKATSAAAKRGHFAVGGMPEEEMEDVPSYEPTGLYSGDSKFMRNLFKSSASGNKNIDLMSGEEMPAQMGEAAAQELGFAKMPEPVGLAGATADLPDLLKATKPKEFAKPAGLSPAAASLPKDLSGIAKLIFAAEGDGAVDTSSALGRYGIVKGTYVDYFKKAFPQRARELGDAGIKALRTTPEGRKLNLQFGPMIIADNAKTLSKAGFDTDARNVYLAHFLGPAGAVRALRADLNTPVELAVDKDSIDANPNVFAKKKIRTVGELLNWSNNTMAKRAKEMGRASGGLAGREGYLTGGDVDTIGYTPSQLEQLAFQEDKRKEEEKAAAEYVAENSAKGLGALLNTTDADLEKIGYSNATIPGLPSALAAGKPNAATPTTELVGLGGAAPAAPAPAAAAPAAIAPATTAPATTAPAPRDNNIFRGKFFTGLKEGRATSIIPLLSGLSAMGTAPTRSLGVAAAAGIGAGAQAAQGQRAFGIKQGELKVAQQLADARTAEVTQGILQKRYQFLEDGQVYDTYTNTFLPTDLATIAKGEALKRGPMEAITGKNQGAVSRADYLRDNPTAGTNMENLPAKTSYKANPSNPRETILAAGEFNPGVIDARADREAADGKMKALYQKLSSPGTGSERYTQLLNLYNLAKIDYDKANTLWLGTLKDVTTSAISAYDAGQQALISVNAQTLVPLIAAGQQALKTKNTINQMGPVIQEGGPLTTMLSKIGAALKDVGASSDLVDSILGAPDPVQQQNLLASQLKLSGMDANSIQALRAGTSAQFEKLAVEALLRNITARADADIAAVQTANASFQNNPVKGNVPEKIIGSTEKSFAESNAPIYKVKPADGLLKKGTPYYVAGNSQIQYAK